MLTKISTSNLTVTDVYTRNCSSSQPTIMRLIPSFLVKGTVAPSDWQALKKYAFVVMQGSCQFSLNPFLHSIWTKTDHTKMLESSQDKETVFGKPGSGVEALGACNCDPLRPSETIKVRMRFEEMVASRITAMAQYSDHIEISCFASGCLFEEGATVAYSLMQLTAKGWKGHVSINIMDFDYQSFIDGKPHKTNQAIGDLWHQLTHAGHSAIGLTCCVFSSLDSYALSNLQGTDCFIGIDISGGYQEFMDKAPKCVKPSGFIATLLKVEQPSGKVLPTYKFFEGNKWKTQTLTKC